ncbi:GNAT family N-acetyltransferase [Sphingomonas sp.]|uniref:GNAT family N-acetyltransferase n=1 Tax=Sphingomonas sp. TaxID=28214 RepID=UPI00286CEAE5|nr:GNAT family N-acetyltransferase [Sphingomonas sp.]
MSLTPVAAEQLAAVVTMLEMHAFPADMALPPSPLRLDRRLAIAPNEYRTLFRLVGAPWLWFSRLVMSDTDLCAIVHDDSVELFAVVDAANQDVGMLELDFRTANECELAFLGLVPALAGHGHGRWLLAEAITRAWRPDVTRVHVHTCTLDHPAALAAYRCAGFTAIGRAIEQFADPRLAGVLPLDCASHIPLLRTQAATATR